MKKIIAILLLILLFTGCGNNESNTKSGNDNVSESYLSIVIYDRGNDSDYWNAITDSFKAENPGCNIDMYIGQDAAIELRDRILSGNSPDFVFLPSYEDSGVTNALIKDKALTDLSDIRPNIESVTLSGTLNNFSCQPYDEKLLLAPLFFELNGMIVNNTILHENDYSIPKTWDDFVELSGIAVNTDTPLFSYSGSEPNEFFNLFCSALISELGYNETLSLLSLSEQNWDQEVIKQFVQYLDDISKEVANGSSTKTRSEVLDLLKNGEIILCSATSNDYMQLVSDDSEYDYSFIPFPMISSNGSDVSLINIEEMYIPIEAKNITFAKKFLLYQYTESAFNIASQYLDTFAPLNNISQLVESAGLSESINNLYDEISDNVFCPKVKAKSNSQDVESYFSNLCVSIFKNSSTKDDFTTKMNDYVKQFMQ